MSDLTKSQKKHLRQLAGQCYEKEMSHALEVLYESFQKWKKSEITPWELNEKIHTHHDQTARELWKIYEQMNDSCLAVSVALAKGVIGIEEVQENCRDLVDLKADFFQFQNPKDSTAS